MPATRITFDSGEVPVDPNAKRQMPDSGGERDAARVSSLDPAMPAGGGADGAGGIGGAGEGAGTGFSDAHVQYGQNPAPAYPMDARRDNEQGEVLLRVLVAADGSVKRVEVVHSSGFDLLDDSAVDAVRTRWRFVPARRDGIGVESWALVPVQFSLRQTRASR